MIFWWSNVEGIARDSPDHSVRWNDIVTKSSPGVRVAPDGPRQFWGLGSGPGDEPQSDRDARLHADPYATGTATITVTVDAGGASSNTITRAFTAAVNALPNLPFAIMDVSTQSNTVGLTWASMAGKLYAIEYSLNLLTWSNLVTGIPAVGPTTTALLNLKGERTGANDLFVQYQMGQAGPPILAPTPGDWPGSQFFAYKA